MNLSSDELNKAEYTKTKSAEKLSYNNTLSQSSNTCKQRNINSFPATEPLMDIIKRHKIYVCNLCCI